MIKKIIKRTVIFFLLIFSMLALWLVINQIDTQQSEISKKLFENQKTVALENNGDIYLKGFSAPKELKPFEVGLKIYEGTFTGNTENRLEFQGSSIGLYCWFLQEDDSGETCQSLDELQNTINQNSVLLNRLEALSKYQDFDEDFIGESYFKGQEFIVLQMLFNARLVALKQFGATDKAIQLWIQNMNMLNNMRSSRQTIVFSAIITLCQDLTDDTILKLTDNYALNSNQYSNIKEILEKPAFGDEGMNLKKTFQAEYNYVFGGMDKEVKKIMNNYETEQVPFYLPNHTKNLYAEYVNETLNMSRLPLEKFKIELSKRIKKSDTFLNKTILFLNEKMFIYNPIGQAILNSISNNDRFLLNSIKANEKRRKISEKIKEQHTGN